MKLFGLFLGKSSNHYNRANAHWRAARESDAPGRTTQCVDELLRVVKYCQLSIDADSHNGDAYLLLSESLLNLAKRNDSAEHRVALLQMAYATWHSWKSATPIGPPFTKNKQNVQQLLLRLF